MAEFRNIQDNGQWYRGQNYTFEYRFDSIEREFGSFNVWNPYLNTCQVMDGSFSQSADQFVTNVLNSALCGSTAYYEDNGNIFLKENGNIYEGISIANIEEVGDGWIKVTVKIESDCALGYITINTNYYTQTGFIS